MDRNDAQLLEEIITRVLEKLSKHRSCVKSKRLVGIDKPMAHLNSLLKKESEQVRVIGIWGMGGIGKTTIAQEIFSQNHSDYDGCCFLEKVSEMLKTHGRIGLMINLFSTLLKESVKELSIHFKRRIGRMKVLIVLDDVKDTDQLRKLFGTLWFRSDSRIILTSRDKQVLITNEVDHDGLYEVRVLDSSEALELFNLNAFKQSHLEMEYYELSKRVIEYAKGIPLVLKVLAHLLRGKDKEVWKIQLDKLKRLSIPKVHDVLRLNYDGLYRLDKKYFLDIACFFNGLNLKVDYMKLLLKDYESDNSVVAGLERLKDKALITISEDSVISMHDILQEMGQEVVCQESSEDPRKHSRLWDLDDICDVLENDKGTDAIRSIHVDLSKNRNLKLSPHVFDKMTKLRFLYFRDIEGFDCFPQGLESFPTNLSYLRWSRCPLESLPEKFSAENLVILDLSYSLVKKLWCGVQDQVNLKEVTLSYSKFLTELPDFSKATNLKVLNLRNCTSLTTFTSNSNSSIKYLTRLRKLDIQRCIEILTLPELPSSLETLLVDNCWSLKTVLFPSTVAEQFKENKKEVDFRNCGDLDERSLINIGLNVQINLMKFANAGSDQAVYLYPGSSAPEWLEYKTTKSAMIIDLSSPHLSPLFGFVFCFVFAPQERMEICYDIKLKITTIEDDDEKNGVDIYMHGPSCNALDHVCMIYNQHCSQYLTRIAKIQTSFKIKVSARAEPDFDRERPDMELKGFGISPIYHSTYHDLIQQMEYGCAGERNKKVC